MFTRHDDIRRPPSMSENMELGFRMDDGWVAQDGPGGGVCGGGGAQGDVVMTSSDL